MQFRLWEIFTTKALIISQNRIDRGLFEDYNSAVTYATFLSESKPESRWEIEFIPNYPDQN